MRFLTFWVGLFASALFFVAVPCSSYAVPSASLPLDSWSYSALEKLAGLGLIDEALQGTRPYHRLEVARQIESARERCLQERCPVVAGELIGRLERELAPELTSVRFGGVEGQKLLSLRELRLGVFYRDGDSSVFPGTDARQFAPNTLNQGITYAENHNLQAIVEAELRLGEFFLFNWRPLAEFQEGSGASFHTLQGLAALGLGPLQLDIGRQSLWWGQGRRGSLVLTDNARPLDMVRLTNPSPVQLPWVFELLGPFRFDLFVSRLEEDRVVPDPWFGGLRFNLRPTSWLELGASRTVLFGGDGRPDVDFDDFLTIVGGENIGGSSESNQLAAIDARIRIPALWGLELYGEYGGEDQADLLDVIPFFSKKAFLLGLHLPRLGSTGRLGLRVEHADLSTRNHDSPVWYRHGTYRSGYVYEGDLLGHPVGGDNRETWAELRWFARPHLTLCGSFAWQRRGETLPEQEKHYQASLEALWQVGERLRVDLHYVRDRVKNLDFQDGEDATHHFAGLEFRATW